MRERNGWARRRRRLRVDDNLKQLMHQLGIAINDALSESDEIAEVIGEIKKTGYDVFLVLEATIGINKREDDDDEAGVGAEGVDFTKQDHEFLRALKITMDE